MSKLGVGEFESSLEGKIKPSTIDARNIFLHCLREFIPKVLKSLSEEPYKLFLKTNLFYESDESRLKKISVAKRYGWTKNERPSWWELEVGNPFKTDNKLIEKDMAVKEFVESVFDWSKKNNLDYLWCREIAYETLDSWCELKDNAELKDWKFEIPLAGNIGTGNKFNYEIFLDYPIYGFRNEVIKEQISCFKKWLDNILDECEFNAKKVGMMKTPQRREDFDHFKWLAMYQCLPLSSNEIAKTTYKERKTVEDGINKAASLCEMKVREPLPSGRKRKK